MTIYTDDMIFRDTVSSLLKRPEVAAVRVSREHYLWLKDQIEMLEQELAATQVTVVAIIGGEVEGRPTSTINYLQRLRELVDFEASTPTSPEQSLGTALKTRERAP